MGTYYKLNIDGMDLFPLKWEINPVLITIFREYDKVTSIEYINNGDGYIYEKPIFKYSSSGEVIKKRLEIMGFSLPKIKMGYLKRINYLNNCDFEEITGDITISFEQLLSNLEGHILGFKESKGDYKKYCKHINYIEDSIGYFSNVRELIYCLTLLIDSESRIEYDISNMEFDKSDNVCTQYVNSLIDDFHINEKILIITEGKTDIEFLKPTLNILFPEFYEYYSFLDFDLGNIGGSVSSIEKIVQGFIGSGIRNRIIVLFDNDTAGKHGVANLKRINIPDNIKVLQYPDIQIANSYPTIGPGGIEELNVNGLAGSIELYLGKDVLSKNSKLEPIQWKGYDEKFKKYQGVLLNKEEIQNRFREKLKSNEGITTKDNPELVKIFELIFRAFI